MEYQVEKIIRQPSLANFEIDFDSKIESATAFSQKVISAYFDFLEDQVDPVFKSHFILWKSQHFNTRVVFSSLSETFIYIYPSSKNYLIVDCTKYPAQMALFNHLFDIKEFKKSVDDNAVSFSVSYDYLRAEYNKIISILDVIINCAFKISML